MSEETAKGKGKWEGAQCSGLPTPNIAFFGSLSGPDWKGVQKHFNQAALCSHKLHCVITHCVISNKLWFSVFLLWSSTQIKPINLFFDFDHSHPARFNIFFLSISFQLKFSFILLVLPVDYTTEDEQVNAVNFGVGWWVHLHLNM